VSSAPVFVAEPAFFYPESWPDPGPEPDAGTSGTYSDFVADNQNRDGMVYVGGNDGMLHAFDAETGRERFAYVPDISFDKLNELTHPGYGETTSHEPYADGSPTYVDAHINGDWTSVLVSGMRAGGQGIYALDITDPRNFTHAGNAETNADEIALWEFTDKDTSAAGNDATGDPDLGFTYGKPSVVRLHSGEWAAVFGNGYNSTASDGNAGSGNAVLFVVSLETGRLIRKIDTGVGPGADPQGDDRPNGLSAPAVVDVDSDSVAELAYAGDLFGNLWKFDLRAGDPNNWDIVSPGGDGGVGPLFQAVNSDADAQAITVRPQVGRHPDGKGGYMVYFGTGKYIHTDDASAADTPTNTFYGIWDNGSTVFTRSELLEQHIINEATVDPDNDELVNDPEKKTLRTTTAKEINNWYDGTGSPDPGKGGWFLDLAAPGAPDATDPGDNHGEKAVTNPILRSGRLIFTTLIPNESVCALGGTGWIMELNAGDGSRRDEPPFDLNQDSSFDEADQTENDNNPSGLKRDAVVSQVAIQSRDLNKETKLSSTSDGDIDAVTANSGDEDRGRQSWQELR
jgi:type IV pilus assembly protein PilY1